MKNPAKLSENIIKNGSSYYGSVDSKQGNAQKTSLIFLLSLVFGIGILGGWFSLGTLEESVPGIGQFVPEQKVRKVTAPFNGVVAHLLAYENQEVKKGQVLAVLDPDLLKIEQLGIKERIAILSQEVDSIETSYEGKNNEKISKGLNNAWLDATKKSYQSRITSAHKQIERAGYIYKAAKENFIKVQSMLDNSKYLLSKYRILFEKGGISRNKLKEYEMEVLKLNSDLASKKADMEAKKAALIQAKELPNEITGTFHKELMDKALVSSQELATLKNQSLKNELVFKRQEIIAPISGIVNTQNLTGNGETITGGEILMSIVPVDSEVIAEVKVSNRDMSYIKIGQKVSMRIDAMPYQRFGKIKGIVASISPSTIENKEGKSFYMVKIKPEKPYMNDRNGDKHFIKSGMTVSADFVTRNKRIVDFLVEPIQYKVDRAFRDPSTK